MLGLLSRLGSFLPQNLVLNLERGALQDAVAENMFKLASTLTHPICNMHRNLRLVWTVGALNPEAHRAANYARQAFQYLKTIGWGTLGAIPAIFGIILRQVGSKTQTRPWIYIQGNGSVSYTFKGPR